MTRVSAASSPADRDNGRPFGAARSELLPSVLRRIGRLEVRARTVVDGFLSGRHKSPYAGRSLEFREHREYSPGDDLRHVDWKVWGRQDRLYVKQFEEETNLRATVVVDNSASMGYQPLDARAMTKHEYAATAACALAYLLVRQHDAVGAVAFAERVVGALPARNRVGQIAAIAETLASPASGAKTALRAALAEASESLPRRGVVVLLSDLLCDPAELADGLAMLRARGADSIVLQVLDEDELNFPFEGPTTFVGLESDARLDANPRALRGRYLDAMEGHLAAVRAACAAERADYRLIGTGEPLDAALVALLGSRLVKRR